MINTINIITNLALLGLLIYYTYDYVKNLKSLREYDRLNKKIKKDQEQLQITSRQLKEDLENIKECVEGYKNERN